MTAHGDQHPQAPVPPRSRSYEGPYGRMFPDLPPFEPPGNGEIERQFATRITAEDLFDKHESLELKPELENWLIPAGYTYFGQFIAHDVTFDATSVHECQLDPQRIHNFRTPLLDLDLVYGGGPRVQPYLYDGGLGRVGTRFHLARLARPKERGAPAFEEEDLPRTSTGTAIIADPRNDSHLILSQMHHAFLKLHNAIVSDVGDFALAQRLTRWHYQWVVLNDYLPKLVGKEQVQRVMETWSKPELASSRAYSWKVRPFLPVEFTVGAFRACHAMVRPSYRLNDDVFGRPIFGAESKDLRGGRELPRKHTIAWRHFVRHGSVAPQGSALIRPVLPRSMREVPGVAGPANVSESDLLRGWKTGLPSGEAVALALALQPLGGRKSNNPLWYYVMREASGFGGKQLGPVGGRIVAEVLIGLLHGDTDSFVNVDPKWIPLYGKRRNFDLADLLLKAGMPMEDAALPWNRRANEDTLQPRESEKARPSNGTRRKRKPAGEKPVRATP